jgi:hypothetical protein
VGITTKPLSECLVLFAAFGSVDVGKFVDFVLVLSHPKPSLELKFQWELPSKPATLVDLAYPNRPLFQANAVIDG